MPHIVPIYAAVLALLFVVLSGRVIVVRRAAKVAVGVAGNPVLERRVRVQANFAEYVPIALLLLLMAELRGVAPVLIHLLCIALALGRAAHAWGMSQETEVFTFRVAGMATTLTVIGLAALLQFL